MKLMTFLIEIKITEGDVDPMGLRDNIAMAVDKARMEGALTVDDDDGCIAAIQTIFDAVEDIEA